jgi:asparagine synthase (glutamine-hydrolysing)
MDRTGVVGASTLRARTEAQGESIRHRGPDDDGVWLAPESGIGLAHRRLAIIDPTPIGRQPAVSRCGQFTIVFNGEIYNFQEIARQLTAEGHGTESSSDTIVLLEAISFWGLRKALEACVGMFALAVFDRGTRTLSLARDRMGIKPLYWARNGNCFAFGSELKAIQASSVIKTTRDPDALAALLRFGYIPAPATIYREIRKLAPGTILKLGPTGEPAVETFWDIRSVAADGQKNQLSLSDPDNFAELERLLQQAVTDRMISDVPLGAWLSGGLDSSLVVALMQKASSKDIRTFSIGFPALGYNEADDARRIANHLGTDHEELHVTPQGAIDTIVSLPAYYDEPFADSSQIPTYVLSHLTRAHVTVALSGDGGDEVFGGYNRYVALPRIAQSFSGWPLPVRETIAGALRVFSPNMWDRMARTIPLRLPPQFGDKVWKASASIEASDPEAAYLSTVSQWQNPHEAVRGTREMVTHPGFETELDDPVAKLQLADTQTYLPDDILTKVDRASMAHALEVRVPLLDHRLVEFAWRLPRSELIASGRTKMPLRRVLSKHVPDDLINRPKSGFAIPIADWLRGPLRDWADDLLSTNALSESGLLEPAPIRAAWETHLSGRRNLQNQLWAVLMYQLWSRSTPD